jgi:hypothetical protein
VVVVVVVAEAEMATKIMKAEMTMKKARNTKAAMINRLIVKEYSYGT